MMIEQDHKYLSYSNPHSLRSISYPLYSTTLSKRDSHNNMSLIASLPIIYCVYRCPHQLKKMIKRVYATCKIIGLKLAPEKTWVGRAANGFDFLGYRISPKGVSIATGSWNRFTVKLHRLFEQGATMSRRLQYVKHWVRWATSGVSCDREALLLNIKHIFQLRFNINGSCLTC